MVALVLQRATSERGAARVRDRWIGCAHGAVVEGAFGHGVMTTLNMKPRPRPAAVLWAALATLVLTAVPGCGDDSSAARTQEPLVLLDSVVLQEADSSLIGELSGVVAFNRGVLVADRRAGVLRAYNRSGALQRVYGRRGSGPGEWARGPRLFFGDGDTLAVATDGAQTRWFALPSGNPLGAQPNPGVLALTASARGIVYGVIDRERGTSLREMGWDGRELRRGGHVPEFAARSVLVSQMISMPAVALLPGDSVVMAFQGSDYLFFGTFEGSSYDSVLVPAHRRRGALRKLLAQVNDQDPSTVGPALYQPSYPAVMAPIAGGSAIAVVYLDMTFIENRRMTGRPYISILVRERGVCSDIEVGGSPDPLPSVAFQGDTLLVLTQEVRETTSTTVLRRYHVRPLPCDGRLTEGSPP